MEGKFFKKLTQSNKDLQADRAQLIASQVSRFLNRRLEDIDVEINQLIVDRDSLLDVRPSQTTTILNPSDFDTNSFIDKYINYGIKLRELEIKKEIIQKSVNDLFSDVATVE